MNEFVMANARGCTNHISLLRRLAAIVILLSITTAAFPQDDKIRFDHISLEQGLSQSTVFAIAQDRQGFMWFATMDGLNRYDGYTFTVYRHSALDSNTISELGIRRLLTDRYGCLWIVTVGGLLDRYDADHDRFVHYSLVSPDSSTVRIPRAISIVEDTSGQLWVGTGTGLLYRFDRQHEMFIRASFDLHKQQKAGDVRLQCLYSAKTGALWLGTNAGILQYDYVSGRTYSYGHSAEDSRHLGGRTVLGITEDVGGNIWIATADGGVSVLQRASGTLSVYRHDPRQPGSLASDRTMSAFADSRSNVWIGTVDAGLDLFEPRNKVFQHYRHDPVSPLSLGEGAVMSFCEERNGALWIGTYNGGVSRLDWQRQRFSRIAHIANDNGSLSHNAVLSMCEDHTRALWVGTDGGGLNRRLSGQREFEHYFHRAGLSGTNSITAVFEDRQGIVWIGTDPGVGSAGGTVMKYDRRRNAFIRVRELAPNVGGVAAFYEDSQGDLWIGTVDDGLRRYDPGRSSVRSYKNDVHNIKGISGNSVCSVLEDRSGALWFGTIEAGLNRFNRVSNQFEHFRNDPRNPRTLSNNTVWCLHEDGEGSLWIGTWGGGLDRFVPDKGIFEHYTMKEGLPSNIVYGILSDDKANIWLSTNHGLCRFGVRTHTCKNYDHSDGLQSNEFSQGALCRGHDGRLFFGGVDGITGFYPDSIRDNPYVAPVVLTSFTIFDKNFPLRRSGMLYEEIDLSYRQNFFAFEFAALDYTAPEKNQYAYMLEGIDKDWVSAGTRRFASYTNISPGSYTFKVKGSNNDGVWNNRATMVAVVITPPFWQTLWFRVFAGCVVVASLFGLHRYRTNRLLEVERTRNRIARDLHDEVSGTITGIAYFSEAIAREVGTNDSQILQKLLSLIRDSTSEVQESMSDIIWSINPENDRWETILPKLRRSTSDLCESKGIHYNLVIPEVIEGRILGMERRHNLWLVYKEMVTNAVKHSGCSELNVTITADRRGLHVSVADNGKGFDPNSHSDRNGIKNIRARAAAMNGKVSLTTAPGAGTRWELLVQP